MAGLIERKVEKNNMLWKKDEKDELKNIEKEEIRDKAAPQESGKEGPVPEWDGAGELKADELARLYASTVKDLREGQIIKSKIMEIHPMKIHT